MGEIKMNLKTAMIFTDKMVLQRDKTIPVWGNGKTGREIHVTFDGTEAITVVDEYGEWKVLLPPHAAGCGYQMCIFDGEEKITLSDVCVGEVWLAGGQSNMEYVLGFEKHFEEVLQKEMNPNIRFFDYPEVSYEGQMDDFDYKYTGFWRPCSKEDLGYFSAVGFYFAENLQKDLNVPIGIVGCNWGGTRACNWMDPAYLKGTESEFWLTDYEKEIENLDLEKYKAEYRKNPQNDRTNELGNPFSIRLVKIGTTREEQLEMMKQWENQPIKVMGPYDEHRPGGLYEMMLKNVWPYAIRGVIWYQGESDSDKNPAAYANTFSKMITCWRDLWKEELPFLFVQLAPFGKWLGCEGKDYPIIRDCQEQVAKTVSNTWMASIGDVGMEWDIHPKNKVPVGNRLALLARGHVYGEDILCDAPEITGVKKKGIDLELLIRHGEGLHLTSEPIQALKCYSQNGEELESLSVEVQDEKLILHDCQDVAEVRFAYEDYYEVNLFNKAGIPMKPFKLNII